MPLRRRFRHTLQCLILILLMSAAVCRRRRLMPALMAPPMFMMLAAERYAMLPRHAAIIRRYASDACHTMLPP